MGGEGAIERWWNAGLMNQDLVHPVGVGGDVFGYLMDTAIERARVKHEAKLMAARAQNRVAPPAPRSWATLSPRGERAGVRGPSEDAGAPTQAVLKPAIGGTAPDAGTPHEAPRDAGIIVAADAGHATDAGHAADAGHSADAGRPTPTHWP